jgi:hypothetical protein
VSEDVLRGAVQAMRRARVTALIAWARAHKDGCGCDEPDSALCHRPVPFDHTESELREALGRVR